MRVLQEAGPARIVRAEADDVELMRGLNQMFGDVFEDPDSYARHLPRDEYLVGLLRDPTFIALAAVLDGSVIGGIAGYELRKFEQERSEIYLYDLGVAENYRRQGIATALVESLKEVARACGAYVIFVQADKPDAGAIAFYQSMTTHQEDVFHFDIQTKG
jgi:aminoglycoside 3-N-acetyltransferase I